MIPPNQPVQSGPPIPTPTHGPGGVFSITCSTTIAAPPLTCLALNLDTSTYPSWNTFVKRILIDSAPPVEDVLPTLAPELRDLVTGPGDKALYPGVQMRFQVYFSADDEGNPSTESGEQVSVLEKFERDGRTGYRVCWTYRGALPAVMQRAERVQEFVEVTREDGSVATEYATWETFGGFVFRLMPGFVVRQVEAGIGRWMDGLKGAAEEAAKESG